MLCPLCKLAPAGEAPAHTRTHDLTCSACGHYLLTFEASSALAGNDTLAFSLAGWVSEETRLGSVPRIDTATIRWIQTLPRPTVKKRAERYLGAVIRLLDGKLIGRFSPVDPSLRVASLSPDTDDCVAIARYLEDLGAIETPANDTTQTMRLLAKGHLLYEEMAEQRALSSQAFVAMWFNDQMKEAYEQGISQGVKGAGYDPLRVDRKEHEGKIDDLIIAEIRRSAFVVADFTDHRGGVYYEAGFAHGLGRRVIFTCRADHMDKLHFDVRQYNTISWNTPSELVGPLQNRILALFGAGPLKPDARPV